MSVAFGFLGPAPLQGSTMVGRLEELTAKVCAVNRANKYAHEIYHKLVKVFGPFVGKKIKKRDGDLLASISELLPEFDRTAELSVYQHRSDYSLGFVVKTCEHAATHGCVYHEATVYIGEVRDSVLVKISPPFTGRFDFTVHEIVELLKKAEVAKKLADEAMNMIPHPFAAIYR